MRLTRHRLAKPVERPAPVVEVDDGRDPVLEYAKRVVSGAEVAGPHVRAACHRHLRDLEEGPKRGLKWELAAAKRAIKYFRSVLRLSEGQFEGLSFILHPSQEFIVGSIFGWKRNHPDHGWVRRFRRAYIEQGKGNGKSPMAGGIGLLGLGSDDPIEAGAEIYSAGANLDQARVLFRDAVKMAKQSPSLASRITFAGKSNVFKMTIMALPQAGAFFRPISREAGKRGSGPRPHFALIDELHEHPDRNTMELLERGFKFRRQPLLLITTNSGSDRNSVCFEEHQHAVKVAHGDFEDDDTFSYVCALDEGDDPLNDPKCWRKANPLLGTIITEDYLSGIVKQAKAIPGKLNSILRLHFCVWTDAETAWISREAWEQCEDPNLSLEDFAGQRCHAGLDLGETKDMTAKALVFEDGFTDEGKPKFAAFALGYTPKDTLLAREELDKAPYSVWVRDGYLTATPGKVVDNAFVAHDLVQDSQQFDLVAVAYDRHLWKAFETELSKLNVVLPIREHAQGIEIRRGCDPDCAKRHVHDYNPLSMPHSVTALETLILERRIRFAINPALRSAVASACFYRSPAGLRRFEKQRATGRIDLCLALTMAVGSAAGAAPEDTGFVDPNELLVV